MRNMSFFLTTAQVRNRTKTVTRRLGWANLKPGERVQACVKCQGIKKGKKVEKICVIECVSNRRMKLRDGWGDKDETRREGFPKMNPRQFMNMFVEHNNCFFDTTISRIEFKYV